MWLKLANPSSIFADVECLGPGPGLTCGTKFADSSTFLHMWNALALALGLHVELNLLTVLYFCTCGMPWP